MDKPFNCLRDGCEDWRNARAAKRQFYGCLTCGFDIDENQRRKDLPLVEDKNGLLHKVIGREEKQDADSSD